MIFEKKIIILSVLSVFGLLANLNAGTGEMAVTIPEISDISIRLVLYIFLAAMVISFSIALILIKHNKRRQLLTTQRMLKEQENEF